MQTELKPHKVRVVALVAQYFVDKCVNQIDKATVEQMLREGIRKLHDDAKSFRGKGKYLGHAHWSQDALKLVEANGGISNGITGGSKGKSEYLAHEHVIPVGVLVRDLLLKNPPGTSVEEYERQIVTFSLVAIITNHENKVLRDAKLSSKMPEGWQFGDDPWARYNEANLRDQISSE